MEDNLTHSKEHLHNIHCHEHKHNHEHSHEGYDEGNIKKLILAIIFFVLALLVEKTSLLGFKNYEFLHRTMYMFLYFASYFLTGFSVIKEAVENLIHKEFFGEEFLMTVATIGAVCMGEYSEAVAVMVLFCIGEFLESKAMDSSKRSISSLIDVRPDKATVKKAEKTEVVLAQQVCIGDIVVVKAGERIPLDGKIQLGSSFVDTSALTGESVPREVFVGDNVLAGFINTQGTLEILVTKKFGESAVSRVLELVQNAQNKKAQAQKFITKFAKVYTPAVCVLALLIATVPPLILGGQKIIWQQWIYRALELLVVSCPCALVISVPLSFFAGLGLASRKGVLIKGSNYLELLANAKTVVFDKTGTLTKGVFEVTDVHLQENQNASLGLTNEELIAFATHAEYFSNHPISKSLKNIHHCTECDKITSSNVQEFSGYGLKCVLKEKTILAGNMRLMQKENVKGFSECNKDDSGTLVHVAVNGLYCGHIVISDVVKDDSYVAIKKLNEVGVKKIVMLTGDSKSSASTVAKKINIDNFYAELLPDEKVLKLEELINNSLKKEKVLFVGDGINDAPVLSRSDVGIAMGAMGSDVAVEAADIVIMDDLPSKVAVAISVAKKTMINVKQNVALALGLKLLIIVLCATGIANMWLAVFGDVGVTLVAVLNSMRLLAVEKNKR